MKALNSKIVAILCLIVFSKSKVQGWTDDPTYGFEELPLNTSLYHIQKPYDLPVSDRYSFIDGVHELWVFSTDKPLSHNSPTHPRTEIMIQKLEILLVSKTCSHFEGYEYYSGVWQFEGCGYVPNGTTGVCIMQVFGADPPRATTFMLRVYNGSLFYYADSLLQSDIYDKWFRLNVIHDVGASNVKIYIDGVHKFEATGRGGTFHYFKCGVYGQDGMSPCMESRWKGIRVLKKL
ncbi:Alginate lyase 2 [Dillenia turbinata]|uniref:Alginate lyase 2 n=1 Tax=Dillenia turbinata TaxID=194707 RepID=A0AAN8V3X9_9MAGN